MKKNVIISLTGLIIIALIAILYIFFPQFVTIKSNSGQPTIERQQLSSQLAKACEVLDLKTAQEFIPNAEKSTNVNDATASSDDIAVSSCAYQETGTQTPDRLKHASLYVRSARTEAGKSANDLVFVDGSMPKNSVVVEDYGGPAFWNPEYGQLNILKNNNWYIVEFGNFTPSGRSLEETKRLADVLAEQM